MLESNDVNDVKDICRICFDTSDGMHFGAYTCRACAAFFRRTVSMKLNYRCRSKEQCSIDKAQRNMCRACRFSKCLTQGMQLAAVQYSRDGIGKRKKSNEASISSSSKSDLPDTHTLPSTSSTTMLAFATSSSDCLQKDSSQNLHSYTESLKILGKMHEGYLHFLTMRKATSSVLTNNLKGDIFNNQQNLKPSNFDSCKKVCQLEAHLIMDITNTYFLPFNELPFEEKTKLFQSFFCYLSHTDKAYQSYKRFAHENTNDRLLMPDGGYIKCSELEKFYANAEGVHTSPQKAAEVFRPCMEYILNVLIAHMRRIQICEIEYVAILGFFLWNDAVPSIMKETIEIIHSTQAAILDDLYIHYRSQGLKGYEITRKIGELMLLLPKLTTSVVMLRENSQVAELFNIFEADICCKSFKSDYGAV